MPITRPVMVMPDVVGDVGDAEVDEHRVAVEQQHVAGLEVAVDDVGLVDRVERLGQAAAQPQQLPRRGSGRAP